MLESRWNIESFHKFQSKNADRDVDIEVRGRPRERFPWGPEGVLHHGVQYVRLQKVREHVIISQKIAKGVCVFRTCELIFQERDGQRIRTDDAHSILSIEVENNAALHFNITKF